MSLWFLMLFLAQPSAEVLVPGQEGFESALWAVAPNGALRLEGVGVSTSGNQIALSLRRFEVWAPQAVVHVMSDKGHERQAPPQNRYFRGSVVDLSGENHVVLTLRENGEVRGIGQFDGQWWMLHQEAKAKSGALVWQAIEESTLTRKENQKDFSCQQEKLPPVPDQVPLLDSNFPPQSRHRGTAAAYTATVAFDSDYEYYQLFGNVNDARDYGADLIAYASTVYAEEVDTELQVGDFFIWTTSSDPWQESNSGCILFEYGEYWNQNHTNIARTTTHFLSGKNTGGGIAWVGVLCLGSFSTSITGWGCSTLSPSGNYGGNYGMVGGLNGSFNLSNPTVMWDIVAVTHEIGHNFNSPHTHCYAGLGGNVNDVDHCYSGEDGCYVGGTSLPGPGSLSGFGDGTIMSYCHLLAGGFSNIAFTFGDGHPDGVAPQRVPARMNDHVVDRAGFLPDCFATCESPQITTQPQGQTVCAGQEATFSVVAEGSDLDYQWQRNGVNVNGATSPTLSIDPVTSANAGTYRCQITGTCGSVTSNAVSLVVNTPPQWTQNLNASRTECAGSSVQLTVTATGTGPLTYLWRKNGQVINGAQSSTLNLGIVDTGDAGTYDVTVSNLCGEEPSETLTLTVQTPVSITQQPLAQTLCSGQALSLSTIAAGSGPLSYQWQRNSVNLNGATSASLSINPAGIDDSGTYRCQITNPCGTVTTQSVLVSVNSSVAITLQPLSQERCKEDLAFFRVQATGDGLSYQWQKNSVDLPGETQNTLVFPASTPGAAAAYRCLLSGTCGALMTQTATLTVTDEPVIEAVTTMVREGVTAAELEVVMPCWQEDQLLSWIWTDTDTLLGTEENPFVLPQFLGMPSLVAAELNTGATTHSVVIRVLSPVDEALLDFNQDGCNDIQDLEELAPYWRGIIFDGDGDGMLTVLDLLFLRIDGSGNCL